MGSIRTIRLQILQDRLSEIAGELTQVHLNALGAPSPWRPRMNLYRCHDRLVICAELAGIDRTDIDLRVEPRRLRVSGRRRPPTPAEPAGHLRQILLLEIDDGRCERELLLPEEIVPDEVRAEQRNGLLWIDLPLRAPT